MPDDLIPSPFDPVAADDRVLAAALQDLPLVAPERSALPALTAALRARREAEATRRWHRHKPLWALAATVVLGVPLAWTSLKAPLPAAPIRPATSTTTPPGDATGAALIARSQWIEAALRDRRSGAAPLDATSAYAAAELEDLIGMTDLALEQSRDPTESDQLWARRVALMQRLAATRNGQLVAAESAGNPRLSNAAFQID